MLSDPDHVLWLIETWKPRPGAQALFLEPRERWWGIVGGRHLYREHEDGFKYDGVERSWTRWWCETEVALEARESLAETFWLVGAGRCWGS